MIDGKNVIVSLTSLPTRNTFLYKTICSLKNQTVKPDKIILYYQDDEKSLPKEVLDLKDDVFIIKKIVSKYRSYSKFYYVLKEYPNDIVILADDDLEYKNKFVEYLLEGYKKHPDCMICNIYKNIIDDGKSVFPNKDSLSCKEKISSNIRPLSGFGTLIPDRFYTNDDIEIVHELCINKKLLFDDEQWLYFCNKKHSYNVYCVGKYLDMKDIITSQYKFIGKRLYDRNKHTQLMYRDGVILRKMLYS